MLAEFHDRRIAHDVHVGRCGGEQHGLFRRGQLRPRRAHKRFCLADFRYGASAAKQRLRDRELAVQGMVRDRLVDDLRIIDRNSRVRMGRDEAITGDLYRKEIFLNAVRSINGDRRPPAAIGLRDLLVAGPQSCLRRCQLRIGFVGDAQGVHERHAGLLRHRRRYRSLGCRLGLGHFCRFRRSVLAVGRNRRNRNNNSQSREKRAAADQFHDQIPFVRPVIWGVRTRIQRS